MRSARSTRIAIGAIGALYAPGDAGFPVAELTERSGGVPRRAHRLAADWARAAGQPAGCARSRTGPATERSDLRRGRVRARGQRRRAAGRARAGRAARGRRGRRGGVRSGGWRPSRWATPSYFFGRERLVAELVARLVGAPLLGVVGRVGQRQVVGGARRAAPGAGGRVLPGSERWAQVVIRPGEHPAAGAERAAPSASAGARRARGRPVRGDLHACRDEAERAAFVGALVEMATDAGRRRPWSSPFAPTTRPLRGVSGAVRLLGANHVLVGPMQRDELRRAIERLRDVQDCTSNRASSTPARGRRRAAGSAAAVVDRAGRALAGARGPLAAPGGL